MSVINLDRIQLKKKMFFWDLIKISRIFFKCLTQNLEKDNTSFFSQPIMEASFNAAMELHGEIAKENASFKKVNDSLMDFTRSGYQWFQVAELTYDSFMVRHSRG